MNYFCTKCRKPRDPRRGSRASGDAVSLSETGVYSAGVLSAGQDHHSGSQQSGDGQQHDPQGHGAGITGLDAGLSRLIVCLLYTSDAADD